MQGIHPYSPGIVRVGGEWEVHVCVQGGGGARRGPNILIKCTYSILAYFPKNF